MDKLQWFKFSPTDWTMGKIQRCPELTQARYLRLICLYWNKECILSLEDAEIEIDKEHLDILLSKKIIKSENNFIVIDFLNEQLEEVAEKSQKRREAVLLRWAKVKENNTNEIQNDTNVLQNDTEESRVDKSRVEKKRVDKIFIPPQLFEVENYFFENGYTKESGKKAFNYYAVADWKDSKGTKVRNWKQKMQAVWFKEENKIKKTYLDSPY
jgi:chemotaxis protein histidine kinase CheA